MSQIRNALVLLTAAGSVAVSAPVQVRAQAGSISGRVSLQSPPAPRRSADRYVRGASASRQIQSIPAVVFVEGAASGNPGSGAVVRMEQRDTAFAPAVVFVQVGGNVEFPNADPFFHNVFSYSQARRFDLGRYPEGESKSVTFDEAGVVNVFCEVHDHMRAAIIVTENRFHAVVADDGTFSLDGVPAGEYTLSFWHPDHRASQEQITVTAGQTTTLEVELRR